MSDAIQISPSLTHPSPSHQLGAAFTGAISAPLSASGWIHVSGPDRVRWLNGMVTNSIVALASGEGCYNFLLNAQGRIQGTAWAFAEAEALLLQTDRMQVAPMMALLERFIIMDAVELEDLSPQRSGLLLAGPHALSALQQCGLAKAITSPQPTARLQKLTWHGQSIDLLTKPGRLFPSWEVWAEPSSINEIASALEILDVTPVHPEILDWMRLLEGIPKFGTDIRDRDLPQETGQIEALHFSKGCYLGQEIVERIRSRGNVHRLFSGFLLEGQLPAPGTALVAAGKTVGELTSVAQLASLPGHPSGLALGLGYLRREALTSSDSLSFPGGIARPVSLPVHLNQPPPIAPAMHPTHEVA